ncbi:gamma-glutamylcyclotransferase family protein [Aidingimonas halophila]|uniref:AIG2-like family protein n=1 Tax=Aidingimonas halophila TaxID=574349 RepID=A0A1H3A0C6_9GAMM|nr:gamma-glutamylcyclotransferase family protein [Aidingimonas halophila]GHC21260.1 gamma-glutamylcyclotransferase [Aidingimonas halophila]SDX22891.1 AIG2-like family protein [Aidingimonas halophila]
MFCFSYGSNMSLIRLRDRVPSARFVAVATLPAHGLRFHKVSKDGSGKCDAEETGNREDRVIGVVYDIADDERQALDRKEGLGSGYDAKEIEVTTDQGSLTALMYFATYVDPALKPYVWYKEHVLIGARENELPSEYIARIEAVEAVDDPDTMRHERELTIYR